MTIGTGTVSMSDIRTEFGVTGAISMSDMYRGGSNVRQKAANNTADNLASTVPTSGTITIDNFRGAAKGFRYTFSSGATNQNASTLFGSDYGVNYPKEIVIDSGVELGATSTSEEALQADTGLSGTLKITNNGTLSGYGGAAGGGTGGDAFEANVTCTFINNGTLRAGGGGGGNGGTGGGGSYNYWGGNESQNVAFVYGNSNTKFCWNQIGRDEPYYISYGRHYFRYLNEVNGHVNSTQMTQNGTTVRRGSHKHTYSNFLEYYIQKRFSANTNGGGGGAGGRGQGYNISAANGSSGSSGGTNAGTGGTGGTGGSFGASGGSGNSGANGNRTNGSGGSGGGAAGKYLRGSSNVTFTNNGTVQGGTA